jgi:hypothetical protein
MEKLRESCSNLRILEIKYADLNSIEADDLPSNLEELSLVKCEIAPGWFKKNNFTKLVRLNLNESSRICDKHIADLVNCNSTLKCLELRDCYRVDDKAIELLELNKFSVISHLNLEGTAITHYALQLICTRFPKSLDYLNIKKCKNIKNLDLNFVRSSFDASSCFQLIT